jgi:hypothetical protein
MKSTAESQTGLITGLWWNAMISAHHTSTHTAAGMYLLLRAATLSKYLLRIIGIFIISVSISKCR